MNELEKLRARGVSAYGVKEFLPFSVQDGKTVIDWDKAAQKLSAADSVTAPNIGVPAVFTTFLDPEVVNILFAVTNATKLLSEAKKGDLADAFIQFPVEDYAGDVTPYSDFTENVSTDVNYNFPSRENFKFQTVIKYGDLETEVAAKAKLNLVASKQRAAAEIIARAHNKFYLYGVYGKQTYGLLNDPNLNPAITPISVTIGEGAKVKWDDKLAADPDGFANMAFNDIAALVSELFENNGGHVDANTPMVLGISNAKLALLSTPNKYGLTARKMLSDNYPNLTIVTLPELSTAEGDMLILTVPALFGQATGYMAYSEKMRLGRVIPELSSFKQKAAAGTWGSVLKRPSLVATMTGI